MIGLTLIVFCIIAALFAGLISPLNLTSKIFLRSLFTLLVKEGLGPYWEPMC